MTGEGETVHLAGHHDVGEHKIDPVAFDLAQGLFGIRHPTDGVAELLEQAGTDGRDVRIVVDQQYRATAARCGGRRMLDRWYDILARQQDRDPGPLAYVAGDL